MKALVTGASAPKDAELLDHFDLRRKQSCRIACENIDLVYLTADLDGAITAGGVNGVPSGF